MDRHVVWLLIFISAYSHPLSNQPQVTMELAVVGCSVVLQGLKCIFFFPMMTPMVIRPSPCVTQLQHGCACKFLPQYVTPFRRKSQTHTTLNYLEDALCCFAVHTVTVYMCFLHSVCFTFSLFSLYVFSISHWGFFFHYQCTVCSCLTGKIRSVVIGNAFA